MTTTISISNTPITCVALATTLLLPFFPSSPQSDALAATGTQRAHASSVHSSPTKQRRAPRVKAIACPLCRTRVRLDSVVRVQVGRSKPLAAAGGDDEISRSNAGVNADDDEDLVAKFGTKVQRVVRELNG